MYVFHADGRPDTTIRLSRPAPKLCTGRAIQFSAITPALFTRLLSHQMGQTLHNNRLTSIYMRVMAEPEPGMHRELTLTAACIRSLVTCVPSL